MSNSGRQNRDSTDSEALRITRAPVTQVSMLIRRPPHAVFEALVDPAVTTRIWFTHSTGQVVAGSHLTWTWDMFGVATNVEVTAVETDRRIAFTWGRETGQPTDVEFRLTPWTRDTTYLKISETGFQGDGDAQVTRAIDSTGGFTFLVSALKVLLEHGVVLELVRDHWPEGLEP